MKVEGLEEEMKVERLEEGKIQYAEWNAQWMVRMWEEEEEDLEGYLYAIC